MSPKRVRLGAAALIAAAGWLAPAVHADSPGPNSLTWSQPSRTFDGGPVTGPSKRGTCLPTSCAKFEVTIDSAVARSWATQPGGLVTTVTWANPDQELDLWLYDEQGNELDSSAFGGTVSQRVVLGNPPAGTYQIWVQSFSGVVTKFQVSAVIGVQDPTPVTTTPSSLRFSPPALVDPQITTGEPSLRLAPDGRGYVDAPWKTSSGTSFVWRSQRAGANLTYELLDSRIAGAADPRHRACSASSGGADSDIAVGPNGQLILVDAEVASVGVSWSSDSGDSWQCSAASPTVPDDDRPWVAMTPTADGSGPNVDAYLAYRALSLSGQFASGTTGRPVRLQIDRTTDGGKSWTAAASILDGKQAINGTPVYLKLPGPVFTDGDGNVYVPFAGQGGRVYIARSTDAGRTFLVDLVAQRLGAPSYGFVSGAADAAGTLYVAWVDQATFDVVYSSSRDGGATWSEPQKINPAGSTAVFPWIAAGRAGDVAIGWYGTDTLMRPDLVPADSAWYPYVARSLDADAASPTFQISSLTPAPVHVGALCVADTPCDASLRRFGDFFTVAIDNTGAVRAVFNDDAGAAAPYVTTVVQTAGLGLRPPATLSVTEPRGDADAAGGDASQGVPQLDLVAQPTATTTGDSVTLRFAVGNTGDLEAAAPGDGESAYWLATWQTGTGQLHYAGMSVGGSGAPAFFGATAPGSASFGASSSYATYPDGTPKGLSPVRGTVGKDGIVSLALPTWLAKPGDVHSLQLFTMTGYPQAGQPTMLDVIDSTAPSLPASTAAKAPCHKTHRHAPKPCR